MNAIKDKKSKLEVISTWLNIIIAVAALIFSTYQYKVGADLQNKANRPFISLKNNSFTYDTTKNDYQALFTIQNYGVHPANNLTCDIHIFSKDGAKYSYIKSDKFQSGNPLLANIETNYIAPPITPVDNIIYLYKLTFNYTDYLSNDKYSNTLYFAWIYKVSDASITKFALRNAEKEDVDKINAIEIPQ